MTTCVSQRPPSRKQTPNQSSYCYPMKHPSISGNLRQDWHLAISPAPGPSVPALPGNSPVPSALSPSGVRPWVSSYDSQQANPRPQARQVGPSTGLSVSFKTFRGEVPKIARHESNRDEGGNRAASADTSMLGHWPAEAKGRGTRRWGQATPRHDAVSRHMRHPFAAWRTGRESAPAGGDAAEVSLFVPAGLFPRAPVLSRRLLHRPVPGRQPGSAATSARRCCGPISCSTSSSMALMLACAAAWRAAPAVVIWTRWARRSAGSGWRSIRPCC
jgi:hypothetical protein